MRDHSAELLQAKELQQAVRARDAAVAASQDSLGLLEHVSDENARLVARYKAQLEAAQAAAAVSPVAWRLEAQVPHQRTPAKMSPERGNQTGQFQQQICVASVENLGEPTVASMYVRQRWT